MIDRQEHILIDAEFNEIICRLIYEFEMVSEVKIIFVAFGVYNMNLGYKGTSQKYNLFENLINEISIGINMNSDKLVTIFDCLNLLIRTDFIEINNGNIIKRKIPKNISNTINVMNSKMFIKLLVDIAKISDQTLVKEVIRNV